MKINKGIAVAVAALSIVGLAACGNSNAASGTADTKADKGLDVIGNTITYDPNHLVNDGKPIQLEYWSWGLHEDVSERHHQNGECFMG